MIERSRKFEEVYNKIHDELKKRNTSYRNGTGFADFPGLVRASTDYFIKSKKDWLLKCHDLRNAMVHEKGVQFDYIAEPHENIIQELEEIKNKLINPQKSMEISSPHVKTLHLSSTMREALEIMRNDGKEDISQIPIYDEKEKFMGLLTGNMISKWLMDYFDKDSILIVDAKVKDVMKHAKMESVSFLRRESTVYDVKKVFEDELKHNNLDIQAIILTHDGNKDQKPLGIITAWDLLKIK